jgi:hypothetical protein
MCSWRSKPRRPRDSAARLKRKTPAACGHQFGTASEQKAQPIIREGQPRSGLPLNLTLCHTERYYVAQLALNAAAVPVGFPHSNVRRAIVQVRCNLVRMRLAQRAVAGFAIAHRIVAQEISHPSAFGAVVAKVAANEHAAIGLVFHVAWHIFRVPGGWPNPPINSDSAKARSRLFLR